MSTSKTFILQEVIDDLVNDEKSLVSPLMKLLYFGQRIKNQQLIEYVSKELNGYKDAKDDVPSYRKTPGSVIMNLQTGWNNHEVNMPISLIEEPLRSLVKHVNVYEGVKTIEMAVESIKKEGGGHGIKKPIPMELLHFIQPGAEKLYHSDTSVEVVGAMVKGNENVLFQVIDAVRSKLLALVMEIGEKFGFDVEIESFRKDAQQNNQVINNYMKTEITNTGDGNIVNTGSSANITATININKGDFDSLRKKLLDADVEEKDIEELKDIVTEEEPDRENKKLGPKASSWIGNMFAKILGGATKIATTAAGHLLADWIWRYYGN